MPGLSRYRVRTATKGGDGVRPSLQKSIADSPVKNFDRYPKGSIVLCNECAAPIFKLDAGLSLGRKAGSAAALFKPLSLADLNDLEMRPDIDAGIRATLLSWTPEQKRLHLSLLTEPKAGDPMICPVCQGCYVQVLSVEKTETIDKGYILELLTIPPYGTAQPAPVRGKRFAGDAGDWIHG